LQCNEKIPTIKSTTVVTTLERGLTADRSDAMSDE